MLRYLAKYMIHQRVLNFHYNLNLTIILINSTYVSYFIVIYILLYFN